MDQETLPLFFGLSVNKSKAIIAQSVTSSARIEKFSIRNSEVQSYIYQEYIMY